MTKRFWAVLAGTFLSAFAWADVTLPIIFGDHMVLQREMKVPLWGQAEPHEKVTVRIAGQEKSAEADEHGAWRVILDPLTAAESVEIEVRGKNAITLKDVAIGEVWLCSGQSNMSFPVKNASTGREALAAADRPKLRLFKAARQFKNEPQSDMAGGQWLRSDAESAKDFAAVGYFFAVDLAKKVDVPIGLIESDWGGTRAEAWIPKPAFDALKLPYEPAWTELWLHPPAKQTGGEGEPLATRDRSYMAPGVIYNGMVAPLAGFGVRGVIWYQGETNTAYPKEYRRVLSTLIETWRAAWKRDDLPFIIVQLSNFGTKTRDWATLRDSQARVAKDLKNVGLVVTFDVGDAKNIHYKDKQTVGTRTALVAEHLAYGMDVPFSGPTLESAMAKGDEVAVHFGHVTGGLVIAKGNELRGFELAGEDGKFVAATGAIHDDTVTLRAPGVTSAKTVRYGWGNDPRCTLYDRAALPAAPFESEVKRDFIGVHSRHLRLVLRWWVGLNCGYPLARPAVRRR